MADHTNEFIKALKEELKKERQPNPREERMQEHMRERHMPPSMYISRVAHFGRRGDIEDTWINLARIIYEQWEAETFPEEPIP